MSKLSILSELWDFLKVRKNGGLSLLFFLADNRHNAVFSRRIGSCSVYLHFILISEKKKRDYAKSVKSMIYG